MDIVIGVVDDATSSSIVAPIIQPMNHVIPKERSLMEDLLLEISTVRIKRLPRPSRIHCKSPSSKPNTYSISPSESNYASTVLSKQIREWKVCLEEFSKQIREWNVCLEEFFRGLQSDFSSFVNAPQIVSSAIHALFQVVLAKAGIKSAQIKL